VTDDDELGAGFLNHRCADLAGECAFTLPMQVLRGHGDVAAAKRLGRRMNRRKRRGNDDLDVGDVLDERAESLDVLHRLRDGLEHLPVAGDEGSSHWGIQNAKCKMRNANSACSRGALPESRRRSRLG
jgi:hypothetical protein